MENIINRRDFLTYSLITLGLLCVDPSKVFPYDLPNIAKMYDVSISLGGDSVSNKKNKLKKRLDQKYVDHLKISNEGKGNRLILDLNTTSEIADIVISEIKKKGLESKKIKTSFYYNPDEDLGRLSYFVVDTNFDDLISKYTNNFGDEIENYKDYLVDYYKKIKVFKETGFIPKKGDLAPIPVRSLKSIFLEGAEKGLDYEEISTAKGDTPKSISETYLLGDQKVGADNIKRLNSVDKKANVVFKENDKLHLPSSLYHNPTEPLELEKDINDLGIAKIVKPKEQNIDLLGVEKNVYRIYEEDYQILTGINMGGVLTESFNLQSIEQLNFYSNETNVMNLAYAYGAGIIEFQEKYMPSLKHVIIDDGHGIRGSGAEDNHHHTGKNEGDFTKLIQKHLANYVSMYQFKVTNLNYSGTPNKSKRLSDYIGSANKIGSRDDTFYFSVHVNSFEENTKKMPPQIYIKKGKNNLKSKKLAKMMLSHVVPLYLKNFQNS